MRAAIEAGRMRLDTERLLFMTPVLLEGFLSQASLYGAAVCEQNLEQKYSNCSVSAPARQAFFPRKTPTETKSAHDTNCTFALGGGNSGWDSLLVSVVSMLGSPIV